MTPTSFICNEGIDVMVGESLERVNGGTEVFTQRKFTS